MLTLSQVAPNEWEFVYPELYDNLMDEFYAGLEFYEQGDLDAAEKVFGALLAQMPDHLDAIHHLALVLSERDLIDQAGTLWNQAVSIGRKAFPEKFKTGKDRLEWGWLENRPFLRCLHAVALDHYERGNKEESLKLCQELLQLNPNDNQGVRAIAEELYFALGRLEDAFKLTEQYGDDVLPEILYGRVLALFKLGRQREAKTELKKAIRYSPLVTKELLKARHRLPSTASPDMITLGGADEAYYYWEYWGQYWEDDPKALEWLRKNSKIRR